MSKPAFTKVMAEMGDSETRISVEAQSARDLEKYMGELGPSDAVNRFLRRYAKVRVRRLYAFHSVNGSDCPLG